MLNIRQATKLLLFTCRDSIKRMLNSKLGQRPNFQQKLQGYKDKIETEMQKFRKFEGELKTKAFSDKNLEKKMREDEEGVVEKVVCQTVEKLKTVLEMAETQASASKRSRRRRAKSVSWFPSVSLLKFHLENLEEIHRAICVGKIETQVLVDFGFVDELNNMFHNLEELDEYDGYWEYFKEDIYADLDVQKSTTNVEEAKKCEQELKRIQANKRLEEQEFEGFRPKNQPKSPVLKTTSKSLPDACQPESGALPVQTSANSSIKYVSQSVMVEEGYLPLKGIYVAKQGQLPPTNNTFEATKVRPPSHLSSKNKVVPPRMMSKYYSNQEAKPSTPLNNQSRFAFNPVRKLNFGVQQPSQPAIVTQLSTAPIPPPSINGFVHQNLSNSNSQAELLTDFLPNSTVSARQANNVSSALSTSLLSNPYRLYQQPPPPLHLNVQSFLQTLAQIQAQQLASLTKAAQNNSFGNSSLNSTPSSYCNNYVLQSTPQPSRRVNTTMMPPPGLTPPHPSPKVAAQSSQVYPSYHHRQTLRNISNQNNLKSQNHGSNCEPAKRGDIGKMLNHLNYQLSSFANRHVDVKGPESMNVGYGSTFQIGTQQHYCLPRPNNFMQSVINARYDPRYQVKLPRETAKAEENSARPIQVIIPKEPAELELSYESAVEDSDLLADQEVEDTMRDEAESSDAADLHLVSFAFVSKLLNKYR